MPVRRPGAVGVNVTKKWQDERGGRVPPQSFVAAKSPVIWPPPVPIEKNDLERQAKLDPRMREDLDKVDGNLKRVRAALDPKGARG